MGGCDRAIQVFCETTAAPEPCARALEDQSPGDDDEARDAIALMLDDLRWTGPSASAMALCSYIAGIPAIGEQMHQRRKALAVQKRCAKARRPGL